jgi:hypothetical protein
VRPALTADASRREHATIIGDALRTTDPLGGLVWPLNSLSDTTMAIAANRDACDS